MPTLLCSPKFHAEYSPLLLDAARQDKVKVEFVLLPGDGKTPVADADRARIDAAFLSRDARFNPPEFKCFGETVQATPGLKWVHFGSSGATQYKWLPGLIARGVTVTTSIGANAEPVSQTALMGLLVLARRGRIWFEAQKEHRWAQQLLENVPSDLGGQTIAIVGFGSVGRNLARYCQALGMRVIGVQRSPAKGGEPADAIAHPSDIRTVAAECDWLALTCPLTSETEGLISKEVLGRMKPTAHLINMSRGEVVDEAALIEVLRAKRIAGAYLDVFMQEPLPADSPIWDLPNVLMSPHNAAASKGNDRRSALIFLDNFRRYARGEALLHRYTE
jgi:phosphoglycerate dehydrogenase-like enzyme